MSEEVEFEDLRRRLVVGRKRDGRSVYDEHAKRELIGICLQGRVSIARAAQHCGLNANLLTTWIRLQERRQAKAHVAIEPDHGAFVPVVIASTPVSAEQTPPLTRAKSQGVRARLPNGLQVDLGHVSGADLAELLSLLSALPCSGSTRS